MRPIKFRAWDKEAKEMCLNVVFNDDFVSSETYTTASSSPREHCVLMEYTGLKDTKGKEIYEGDVLSDSFLSQVVEWQTVKTYDYLEEEAIYYDTWGISKQMIKEFSFEIIGNIYENPELLEE